ncbi:MAG: fibronectin type III domain-containing protein [Candidatus Omnitrophota bacterium]
MGKYQLVVTDQDEIYPKTIHVTVTLDLTPPTIPSNLTASYITSSSVTLNWTASIDNIGGTDYYVIRNKVLIDINSSGFTWIDHNVTPNTTYTYQVMAVDAAGNCSMSNGSKVIVMIPS